MNNRFKKNNIKSILNKKDKVQQVEKKARDYLKPSCEEELSEEECPRFKDED
ncbi:hypothetical protein OAM25_03845 [Gammaproteobacteria bacterium]|nr:hypothetical protein [Gammaproteobacteria bacterium]